MSNQIKGKLTQVDLDKKSGRLRKFGGTYVSVDLSLFTNKEIVDLFKNDAEITFVGDLEKKTLVASSYLLD